jgi:AcrR family transcriptional regulator
MKKHTVARRRGTPARPGPAGRAAGAGTAGDAGSPGGAGVAASAGGAGSAASAGGAGSADGASKPTRKGRETDEAFRAAARKVFACDGYLNARISDIAAEAGKSVASFYNYYDTKAALLVALAEDFHTEATEMAVLPYRSGLAPPDALREAVAGFWRTYAKRRGELIGVFQAAMLDPEFLSRWLDIRAEAITRIAGEIRRAQAAGFCPGIDPVLTASALSAMLEHFCYIWLGQGGERVEASFDDERAIDTLATIWVKSVYWLPQPPS